MKALLRSSFIFLMISGFLAQPLNVKACGPFLPYVSFDGPESPKDDLGVLRPESGEKYLSFAYDRLSGRIFTPQEEDSIVQYLNERESPNSVDSLNAREQWEQARRLVKPEPSASNLEPHFLGEILGGKYVSYLNITEGALLHAAQVLRQRAFEFGNTHPAVVDWRTAQDRVFATSVGERSVPDLCSPMFPLVFQYDRFYQIAAANFYLRNFDLAIQQFNDLSRDSSNQWSILCRYMVGRALIRRATLESELDQADSATLERAYDHLIHMLVSSDCGNFHVATKRLIDLINTRLHPDRLFNEYASFFLECPEQDLLRYAEQDSQEWHDFNSVRYGKGFWRDPRNQNVDSRLREAKRRRAQKESRSDWVECFLNRDSTNKMHAFDQWKMTGAIQWLVCVLSQAKGADSTTRKLLKEAKNIPSSSQSYVTVAYHVIRLMSEMDLGSEARVLSDSVIKTFKGRISVASINRLMLQRAKLASSYSEYLSDLQLNAVSIHYRSDSKRSAGWQNMFFLAPEANEINFAVPLTILCSFVLEGKLKSNQLIETGLAVWTRSVLLKQDSISIALAEFLALRSERAKQLLSEYLAVKDQHSSRFAALCVIMKNPGMSPIIRTSYGRDVEIEELENYRDNWWTKRDFDNHEVSTSFDMRGFKNNLMNFLRPEEQKAATIELGILKNLPPAFTLFVREAVEWAKSHKDDPRSPEALHYSIRSARYTAEWSQGEHNSREAFDFLHKYYPKSSWTRKTPYWY